MAFSNDSRFVYHQLIGLWRIWCETSQRQHPSTITVRFKMGGRSIIVREVFSGYSLSAFIIEKSIADQHKYASILAADVQPSMQIIFPRNDGIYQQDNARCYTTCSVVRGSKSTRICSPYSPERKTSRHNPRIICETTSFGLSVQWIFNRITWRS